MYQIYLSNSLQYYILVTTGAGNWLKTKYVFVNKALKSLPCNEAML